MKPRLLSMVSGPRGLAAAPRRTPALLPLLLHCAKVVHPRSSALPVPGARSGDPRIAGPQQRRRLSWSLGELSHAHTCTHARASIRRLRTRVSTCAEARGAASPRSSRCFCAASAHAPPPRGLAPRVSGAGPAPPGPPGCSLSPRLSPSAAATVPSARGRRRPRSRRCPLPGSVGRGGSRRRLHPCENGRRRTLASRETERGLEREQVTHVAAAWAWPRPAPSACALRAGAGGAPRAGSFTATRGSEQPC